MSLKEIETRQANEMKLFEIAKQIRTLLDEAAALDLPDSDGEERAIALATE